MNMLLILTILLALAAAVAVAWALMIKKIEPIQWERA